jgi:hypothetical protein
VCEGPPRASGVCGTGAHAQKSYPCSIRNRLAGPGPCRTPAPHHPRPPSPPPPYPITPTPRTPHPTPTPGCTQVNCFAHLLNHICQAAPLLLNVLQPELNAIKANATKLHCIDNAGSAFVLLPPSPPPARGVLEPLPLPTTSSSFQSSPPPPNGAAHLFDRICEAAPLLLNVLHSQLQPIRPLPQRHLWVNCC